MALTEGEVEWMRVLLENLEAERKKLYPRAQSFVDDQIARFQQYESRMLVSPKQKQWLTDLHREFCPGCELPDPTEGAKISDKPDYDDDVPF